MQIITRVLLFSYPPDKLLPTFQDSDQTSLPLESPHACPGNQVTLLCFPDDSRFCYNPYYVVPLLPYCLLIGLPARSCEQLLTVIMCYPSKTPILDSLLAYNWHLVNICWINGLMNAYQHLSQGWNRNPQDIIYHLHILTQSCQDIR